MKKFYFIAIFGICYALPGTISPKVGNAYINLGPCNSSCCEIDRRVCYDPITGQIVVLSENIRPVFPWQNPYCAGTPAHNTCPPNSQWVECIIICGH